MVHDGNVYFERCYGAEFDARISPRQREACWSAWLAHYTRHQPAERIDYAMRRVEAIQAGDQTLKLPGFAGGETPAPADPSQVRVDMRRARVGSEVPTVEARGSAREQNTDEQHPADGVPNGCGAVCGETGSHCEAGCPADSSDCRRLCVREKEICLRGCY
jgi:hypothetical protein